MQPAWQLVQFFCDPFFAFVLALSLSHVLTLTVKLHPLQTSVRPSWSARRLQPSARVCCPPVHPSIHPSIQLSVRNWRASPFSLSLTPVTPRFSSPLLSHSFFLRLRQQYQRRCGATGSSNSSIAFCDCFKGDVVAGGRGRSFHHRFHHINDDVAMAFYSFNKSFNSPLLGLTGCGHLSDPLR